MCDNKFWPVDTHHAMNIKAKKANVEEASKTLYCHYFDKMTEEGHAIYDRMHLGEVVYSPMYKNYNGEYVYGLEEEFIGNGTQDDIFLFLLVDTAESISKRDDGDGWSSDLTKMTEERNLFIDAFNKSNIENKMLVEIQEYDLDTDKVFNAVVEFIEQRIYNV